MIEDQVPSAKANEKWVILHGKSHVFLFCFDFSDKLKRVVPYWTLYIEKARVFPTERAVTAVMEEWGLEDIAEPCVICTSDS